MTDWKAITTAPRDGTQIIVFNADVEKPTACVVRFVVEPDGSSFWEIPVATQRGPIAVRGITHWMHLPPPPPSTPGEA